MNSNYALYACVDIPNITDESLLSAYGDAYI